MGRATLVLFALVVATVPTVRAQSRRLLMDPEAPTASAVRPASFHDDDERPAARFAKPDGERRVPAKLVERPEKRPREADDFLDRKSDLGRRRRSDDDERSTHKFGFSDLFSREHKQSWFCSDHGFDQFAAPISNPFLFEDPRAITELRPVFIYQKVPSPQQNFQGGSLFFAGGRGSIAFTDRLSLTINKVGGIGVYPGSLSIYDSKFSLTELWFGPKVTLIRDPEFGTILSAGAIVQLPIGNQRAFQDTGNYSITPYASIGQTLFKTRVGSLNGIANAGYSLSGDKARSDYLHASAHLDFDLFDTHRIYPVAELNWFAYTTNGTARAFAGEGRDLINFGGQAKGSNLLTGALGGRFKLTESMQLGAAYEIPLVGNRDVFHYRFTLDLVFKY